MMQQNATKPVVSQTPFLANKYCTVHNAPYAKFSAKSGKLKDLVFWEDCLNF